MQKVTVRIFALWIDEASRLKVVSAADSFNEYDGNILTSVLTN